MLISIGLYVFNVVCAARLAICRIAHRQLAMQFCVLCSFVRCWPSNQIERRKKNKKKNQTIKSLYTCFSPVVSEAMERLLLPGFFGETRYEVPEALTNICADPDDYSPTVDVAVEDFFSMFETLKVSVRNGDHGKTAQFWVI